MKKGQKRKAPWLRALAIMLAMSMLMTSSGFQVLAQEAGTEISAEQIAAEQARIAAEQAAAAQAAAAEAAAEQARIAAEQAAAEQARIAAEQAAKAQSEAESEAARIAAEQAAAAQAAAESEAARIAAEQAAAESEAARIAAEQAAKAQSEAESEAARIAAEQAAKAQSEAESEAARIAAEEAAKAQSEAESEAARIAAEQAQAESQQASEEAAAAQAAAEAAAAQAAADAETARKQQEAAAQNKKQPSKEAKSEESEPIEGGKLVLKMDAASTQEEGEYAKIKAEYGLGENSPIEAVETRLYIWSDTAELPQFDENNQYQDPASKRIFLLKRDSEGDRYVEYMLKAGESFKQEFLFADSSAEDGATVTFEISFGAEGEVPTDFEVPEKKSVVTYTLPEAEEETEVPNETVVETEAPEETEVPAQTEAETVVTEAPAETEAPVVTEAPTEAETPEATEVTEAPTETEAVTEAVIEEETEVPTETEAATEEVTESAVVENIVTFEVAEGAAVTVDGVDVTNATALAKDGTIYFTVTVLEGFELVEVLVDGSIPARTTDNAGEYIIENIKTDATVVAVTIAAVETESETEGFEQLLMMMNLEVDETAAELYAAENISTNLKDYITDITIKYSNGNSYNPNPDDQGTWMETNGWFLLDLKFMENLTYQLPVYDATNADATTVVYELPAEVKLDPVTGQQLVNPTTEEVWGTYDIVNDTNGKAKIKIYFNDKVNTITTGEGTISVRAQFNVSLSEENNQFTVKFEGVTPITILFKQGNKLTAYKEAGSYVASDPEADGKGTFEFTIAMNVEETLTDITITDTLGRGLTLLPNSIKLDDSANGVLLDSGVGVNQFVITINELSAGQHELTYKATLAEGVIFNYNGDISGLLTNHADISNEVIGTVPVDGNAEYTHTWLRKENSGTPVDGKIYWTITLNVEGDQDVSGLVLKDKLSSVGINYDLTTPITVNPSINGSTTLNWSDVTMSADGKSWSFTMPEGSGKSAYTFTYATTVESNYVGDVFNTVTVNNKFPVRSETTIADGIGIGIGQVEKNASETVDVDKNGNKYVLWTTTLTIPAGEYAEDTVVYTDTLYGSHEFDGTLEINTNDTNKKYQNVAITSSNSSIELNASIENTKSSFEIEMGDFTAEDPFVVTITYYSKVIKNGTLNNVGALNTNGKASSDSDDITIVDSNFQKDGSFDAEKDRINWEILVNKEGNQFVGGYIELEDTLPTNQVYVDKTAYYTVGGESFRLTVFEQNGVLKMSFNERATTEEIKVYYDTTFARDDEGNYIDDRSEAITLTNSVIIKLDEREIGDTFKELVIPSNVFDKALISSPEAPDYTAVFELSINEGNAITNSNVYEITDDMSNAISLNTGSIVVTNGTGSNVTTLGEEAVPGRPYYNATYDADTKILSINIMNAESGSSRVYHVSYEATIRPGSNLGGTNWDNSANFKAGNWDESDGESGTVYKEQTTEGTMDGLNTFVKLYKGDFANSLIKLSGAKFQLQKGTWNDAEGTFTWIDQGDEQTTDANGIAYFGQQPGDTNPSLDEQLNKGVYYRIIETEAPSGYLATTDAIYFQIDPGYQKKLENGVPVIGADGNPVYEAIDPLPNKGGITFQTVELCGSVTTAANWTVTNVEAVKVKVNKVWDDGIAANSHDAITVKLIKNGNSNSPVETATLNSSNNWTKVWSDLRKYDENKKEITYTVEEVVPTGYYSKTTNGDTSNDEYAFSYVITNSKTKVEVEKVWNPASGDDDGNRPESVTVQLQKKVNNNWQDITGKQLTLSSSNNWRGSWNDLEKYDSIGNAIEYNVRELNPTGTTWEALGYNVQINSTVATSGESKTSVVVTNSYERQYKDVEVEKIWKDNDNAELKRPESIFVTLTKKVGNGNVQYIDVQELKAPKWSYAWDGETTNPVLLAVEDGQTVTYDVVEGKWENGELKENTDKNGNPLSNSYTVTRDTDKDTDLTKVSVEITNTIIGETVDKTVNKEWVVGTGVDVNGNIPASIQVELGYIDSDGKFKEMTDDEMPKDDAQKAQSAKVTLTSPNWTATWQNLPKYDVAASVSGTLMRYAVRELNTDTWKAIGWTSNAKSAIEFKGNSYNSVTITNTYEKQLTNHGVLKQWNDNFDQDGKRPLSIKVTLWKQVWNGKSYNNAVATEETAVLKEENSWKAVWTNLPKYENGKLIIYSVKEDDIDGYDLETEKHDGSLSTIDVSYKDGTLSTLKNKHVPVTTSVTITKKWDDDSNRDGKRWSEVKVQLWKEGATSPIEEVTLYATQFGNSNTWSYTWNNLPVYENGKKVVYYAKELLNSQVLNGYTSSYETVEGNTDKLTLVNSYTPEKTSVKVQKIWNDNNNQDKIRPSKITFTLQKRVGSEDATAKTATDFNGNAIAPYTVTVEEGNYTATDLTHTWNNLPVKEGGKQIYYTVEETMTNIGSAENRDSYDVEINTVAAVKDQTVTITATNTYAPATTSIGVKKVWVDDDNREAKRPEEILVQLYANGQPISQANGGVITLPVEGANWENNVWAYTWTNLPKKENGIDIVYTVDEVKYASDGITTESYTVPQYTKTMTDSAVVENGIATYTITNTHTIEKTERSVVKVWDDDNNRDKVRPTSVTVSLQKKIAETEANDEWETVDTQTLTASTNPNENWRYEWSNLPKFEKYYVVEANKTVAKRGTLEYKVVESAVDKYTTSYAVGTVENAVTYSSSEQITNSEDKKITFVKNSYNIETIEVTVSKAWDDNNDHAKARPEKVYAKLYRYSKSDSKKELELVQGAEIAELYEDEYVNWTYTWKNLTKYTGEEDSNGKPVEYVYVVREFIKSGDEYIEVNKDDMITGYDAPTYSEYGNELVIKNHYDTERVSRTVFKYWRGDSSKDVRPAAIELQLMMSLYDPENVNKDEENYAPAVPATKTVDGQDGSVAIAPVKVKGNIDTWIYTWDNLDKYYNNMPIKYSVVEVGYYETENGELIPGLPSGYQVVYSEAAADIPEIIVKNVYSEIEISKVSATTGLPLTGAEFAIYEVDAYDLEKEEPKEDAELILKLDGTAKVVLTGEQSESLTVGETYILVETKAPIGYKIAAPQTFTVNADGTTTKVVVEDEPTKIQLSKVEITGQAELPNAQLQVLDEEGNVVDEWTSGYTPHVIEGILEVGKTYYFRETLAPNGYAIAADVPFVVEGNRGVTQKVKMEDAVTSFTVEKKNGESFVEGAELVIWKNDAAYTAYREGNGTPTVATDYVGSNDVRWTSDGTAHTVSGLKPGSYVLHEISAPAGYALAEDIPFVLNADGTVDGIDIEITDNVIEMYDNTTEIVVSKKAILGDETVNLVGAELVIYVADETGAKTDEVAKAFRKSGPQKAATASVECRWTTGDEEVYWIGIPAGKYVLVEKSAPAGYKLAEDIPFVIHEDGSIECGQDTVTEITMMNERTELTVSKKAVAGTDELPGAGLAIYAVDADGKRTLAQVYDVGETGFVADVEDNGCIWTSGETQKIWTGIPAGKYVLVEEVAPEGYTRAQDIYFEIEEDGTVVSENLEGNVLTMRDKLTEIKIHKLAEDTTELLVGAKLQILDEKGTVCDEWTSGKEEHVITGLPVGTYTLREISAPAGYEVVQDVTFEITDEYKVVADTVEMTDTVVEFTVGKIDLYEKKDENGTTSEVVEIPVEGATLQILNADGKTVATTKYYDNMETTPNEYLEWITGNTDKTIRGLAAGSYILREKAAPDGYVIAEDIAFTVNQYGDIVRPNDSVPGNRLTMVDEPIRLEITKYGFDVDGKKIILPGASLEIHEATGDDLKGIGGIVSNVYGDEMIFESSETAVELKGIKPGTYWLVETNAPAGYTIAEPIQFVINGNMTVAQNDQNPATAELQNSPTEIIISKKDLAYEEELAEVELQILDAEGNIAETIYYDAENETPVTEKLQWITDGEPRTIKGLPVGEYTLVETKAPAGYTIADPITFRIDKDGNKVIIDKEKGAETDASDGITMWNDTVKVYIDKKETGTDTFVMGAAFELHEADETLEAGYKEEVARNVYDLEIAFTTGEADVTNVYKTCADGSIELTGVKPGTYYLVETKVPFGYKKQAEPTLIVVADDQTVSTEPTDVTVYNEPTEIEVLKTDKKTGKALAGATLGLYSAVFSETAGSYEATDLASIFDASQNEVEVEAWTTSTEAKVFKGLKPGYYVLTELAAPAGYTIADPVAFRLNTDGTVEIYDAENKVFNLLADADGNATIQIVVENTPIRLEISKTGFTKDGKVVPLQGAKMEIHEKTADGEIGDIIYNVYGDKMRFESATEAVALDGVVPGTYWLVELEAPEGYMLAEPIEFTINEDMTVSQNPKELIMKDCPIEVEFSKVDITNEKELAGAKLQVMDKDGKEIVKTIYGEELVWTSTTTPKKFTGLPAGEYILRETAAPEGYAIAKDVAFTITSELTVLNKVVMKDEPTKVVISKKAITGVKELEGAQLQVLDTAGKVAKTIYGEELSWTSGQTPKEFLGLPTGTYTLHEVLPPEGYAYAQDVKFEVKDDGVAAKVEMKDDTTKVTISKMDVTNNKELAGAHLILKDAQGEIVAEWTSTGKPKEMNGKLIAGATYTLTEISAPVGYDIAKDITFTVNTDGTINQVVMDDKVADGKGSVTVQKIVMQDGKYLAVDYTFYTALFADEACTQRVSSVKPLFVNGSYTTSTIFTNLQYGTYYVAETDEFGNAISEAFMIESIDIIDGKAVLKPSQATAKSTIINHVAGFDEGYYKDGEIVVNKTVLVNGVETKVTDTFYFALFTDAALTMMYDTGVVELKLKDKAKGSITFEELPYGTYYLAETDKDGNPVDEDYEYTAIISSSYCSLDAENRVAEREVINSKIDIPEYGSTTTTTTTTGTTTTSVKTGDETPVVPYAAAMALSAAVLALLTALSRKRGKRS